jgi:hypothetical protein
VELSPCYISPSDLVIGIIGTEGSGALRRLVEDLRALGRLAAEALRIIR